MTTNPITETSFVDLAAAPEQVPSDSELRSAQLDAAATAWSTRINANPASAQLTYHVRGQATGSVATTVTAGAHTFVVDEPAALAGEDSAASPVEYALGALIACQVVVIRLYAHTSGLVVDDIDIAAEGDIDVRGLFGLDDSVRAGFSAIRLTVTISGPESAEKYQQLVETAESRCPVFDLFSEPTPIEWRLASD